MQKAIKTVSVLGFFVCVFVFIFVWYGTNYVPDAYTTADLENLDTGSRFFNCECSVDTGLTAASDSSQTYSAQLKLLDTIPVKDTTIKVVSRRYVIPGGNAFGLRLFADGVIVTDVSTVSADSSTLSPAKKAGIKEGDIIQQLGGAAVTSNAQIGSLVRSSGGRQLKVVFVRNGKTKTTEIIPVKSTDGSYKIGLWVRDSTAGVGTVTFIEPHSGIVAGLGHAICDSDTGAVMPVKYGELLDATVRGCVRGTSGTPGELCGIFGSEVKGRLYVNGVTGVYGLLSKTERSASTVPVALSSEVKTGKAQIIATVDGDAPQYFDVEITKILDADGEEKNMVVRVVDQTLIDKTGGIVQGMSGSPIVQNGMLVGAVTHVFVNDPLQGYAIYAEKMMETAQTLENTLNNSAA